MSNGIAVATKPPLVVLRERLNERESEIKAALTDAGISPAAFIRAIVTSATINPDILACSWPSVWIAVMRACRDGLAPDGIEGALVAYKSTCNWLPMYQGLLRRFRRSGQFKWIGAELVRQGEPFSYYIDETGPHLRHEPGDDFDAPMVKVYAAATTKDGAFFCTVLTKREADKIKAMSRTTRDDAPWRLWESEMYRKTAFRRLSKVLPSVRDLMGEDDDELVPNDTPRLAPIADAPREAGPVAALDEFAQSGAPVNSGTAGEPATSAAVREQTVADEPAGAAHNPTPAGADAAIVAAHEWGKRDRARGVSDKSVPTE